MHIRDRIRELRRVPAKMLQPHPRNWRTHPDSQRDRLKAVLAEIGYADALIARELEDGSLQLLDGHLRAETTPETEVPVLIVDLDDAEAETFLAFFDPLAALAESDDQRLRDLLADIATESPVLRDWIDTWHAEPATEEPDADRFPAEGIYQLIVDCTDETQQQELYSRLTEEGYTCRVIVL
ncbi:MAG: hypothetical protein D6741_08450 [Planctomycetota bacterium]|nr:MAG: hypothetical protein D6741_08450 [Planctomycetota bacterium]